MLEKNGLKIWVSWVVVFVVFCFYIEVKANVEETKLTRGEAVQILMDELRVVERNRLFFEKCFDEIEFCLLEFSAKSKFQGLSANPLRLFPDVDLEYKFADSINRAALLGLVEGYLRDDDSPFRPDRGISRIEGLKIALRGAQILKINEKQDFENKLGEFGQFLDKVTISLEKWWYWAYLEVAVRNGVLPVLSIEELEKDLSKAELKKWIMVLNELPKN